MERKHVRRCGFRHHGASSLHEPVQTIDWLSHVRTTWDQSQRCKYFETFEWKTKHSKTGWNWEVEWFIDKLRHKGILWRRRNSFHVRKQSTKFVANLRNGPEVLPGARFEEGVDSWGDSYLWGPTVEFYIQCDCPAQKTLKSWPWRSLQLKSWVWGSKYDAIIPSLLHPGLRERNFPKWPQPSTVHHHLQQPKFGWASHRDRQILPTIFGWTDWIWSWGELYLIRRNKGCLRCDGWRRKRSYSQLEDVRWIWSKRPVLDWLQCHGHDPKKAESQRWMEGKQPIQPNLFQLLSRHVWNCHERLKR